jgi:GDP-4-dehydro-6-deoxy-D-mannose reductase
VRALVIGADGFAGRWLVRHLVEMGDTVYAAVGPGYQPPLDGAASIRQIDVRDDHAVGSFIREVRPEGIYYLAGISRRGDRERWASAVGVSLLGALHVVLAAADLPFASRVLYISTGYVYGASATPIDESGSLAPSGAYAAAKLAGESALGVIAAPAGVDLIVVRPFNHIGPGQSQGFVVPTIAAQLAAIARGSADPVVVLAGPDAVRDFSDVRDVVAGYRLLAAGGQPGEIYNLASGIGMTVSELAGQMCVLSGISARIDLLPGERSVPQPASLVGDAGKLRKIGWAPRFELSQTLSDVLAEYLPHRDVAKPAS